MPLTLTLTSGVLNYATISYLDYTLEVVFGGIGGIMLVAVSVTWILYRYVYNAPITHIYIYYVIILYITVQLKINIIHILLLYINTVTIQI